MSGAYRQEVFNVLLAQLLQERGVITAPESIIKLGIEKVRRMPDVIVNFHGLRTAIEGEVSGQPDAQKKALESAQKRVEEGVAHIGIAVIYPKHLRKVAFTHLKSELANGELYIAILTESGETGFVTGNVDYLESALRHTFEQLVQEDVVAAAVAELDVGIGQFADAIVENEGAVGRMADILGVRALPGKEVDEEEDSE
jgi:hypothetical protein